MKFAGLSIFIVIFISLSILVTAVKDAAAAENPVTTADTTADQNTVLADGDVFKPLADLIQPVFTKINVVVGGLFGLYIILILIRIYYERKKLKVLQDIRFDIDQQNHHYHLPTSRSRRGPLQQFFASLSSKRLSRKQTYNRIIRKK